MAATDQQSPLTGGQQNNNDEGLLDQFKQQRLKAWQSILPPWAVIALYFIGGCVFLVLGVVLLLMSWGVQEHTMYYGDTEYHSKPDVNGVVDLSFIVEKDMEPPIWVYYQLDKFHQNHRRYVKSRDDNQLQAPVPAKVSEQDLSACKPAVTSNDGRALYPCGLVARSVFNDTFAFVKKGPKDDTWKQLDVDSSAKTIAWAADVESGKFKNYNPEDKHEDGRQYQEALDMWMVQRFPPVSCMQTGLSDVKRYKPAYVATKEINGKKVPACQDYGSENPKCNFVDKAGNAIVCPGGDYKLKVNPDWGLTSGHFMTWMRVAGLPHFRKLWGKIDEPLAAGTEVKVYVADNFPVEGFGGQKAVVVSTSSTLGGRNDFLGIGYLVVGVCCLIAGIYFLVYPKQ